MKVGDKFKLDGCEWEVIDIIDGIIRARTIWNADLYAIRDFTENEIKGVIQWQIQLSKKTKTNVIYAKETVIQTLWIATISKCIMVQLIERKVNNTD